MREEKGQLNEHQHQPGAVSPPIQPGPIPPAPAAWPQTFGILSVVLGGLGIAYHGSPIVEGAGKRYFDDSVRGGKLLHRFVLVVGRDADTSAQAAAKQIADSMGDVVELRVELGKGMTLVRPDGYLAWRGAPTKEVDLLAYLKRWLRDDSGRAPSV